MSQRLFGLCSLIAVLLTVLFSLAAYKSGHFGHVWPTLMLVIAIISIMLLSQWNRRAETMLVMALGGMLVAYIFGVEVAGGWHPAKANITATAVVESH